MLIQANTVCRTSLVQSGECPYFLHHMTIFFPFINVTHRRSYGVFSQGVHFSSLIMAVGFSKLESEVTSLLHTSCKTLQLH